MKLKQICPKCSATTGFTMEKCPDGKTICGECGYAAPHLNFYVRLPEETVKHVTKDMLINYLVSKILEVKESMTGGENQFELMEKYEEIELVDRLIKYVQEIIL